MNCPKCCHLHDRELLATTTSATAELGGCKVTPEEFAESMPKCLSCGEPFAHHRGLVGMCAELAKAKRDNANLREALGGLIGYASSVDVDNVPWVRGLALRINRAMDVMGVEEGYVVIGGKIVKVGGE